MATLAATATPTAGLSGLLFVVLMIATLCYLVFCWFRPFGTCRKCHGSGKRRSPFGRAFGLCRRCGGDRQRLRIGRRIINSFRELHDKGTR